VRARPSAATIAGRVLALVLAGIVAAVAAAVYASEARPPAVSFEAAGDEQPGVGGRPAPAGAGPTPVPGDWVFGDTGRFRLDGEGTSIAELTVALGCARELKLKAIPVDPTGRFTATVPLTHDSGRMSEVSLIGRFLDAWTAAVEIEVQGGACSSERLRAVARLK
jgi:hypothetical protein